MKDNESQNLSEVLEECFNYISETQKIETCNKVLVHCLQGISRSTTILTAYLIVHLGYTLDQSLEIIRRARPQANPNRHFLRSLKSLESEIQTHRECAEGL